jgi:GxxExxY protein
MAEDRETDEMLARRIIGCAMKVHRNLGGGFIESVYANALAIEFRNKGEAYIRGKKYPVAYEGTEIGCFNCDFLVEDRLIVELKAVEGLAIIHSVQLVNYLAAARLDLGLLLNFGGKSLEFKTKTRVYSEAPIAPNLQS